MRERRELQLSSSEQSRMSGVGKIVLANTHFV